MAERGKKVDRASVKSSSWGFFLVRNLIPAIIPARIKVTAIPTAIVVVISSYLLTIK